MQTAQCPPGTAFYFNGENVLPLLKKIIKNSLFMVNCKGVLFKRMFLTEIQAIKEVDPRRFEAVDRDGNQSLSIYEHFRTLTPDTLYETTL
jgi:hypothetical protein